MLDNTHIHNKSSTHVDINVEQANVHDAARLLSEMETKARERLLDSLVLKDNIIEGKVFKSYGLNGEGFDLAFKINGKRQMTHVDIEALDYDNPQGKVEAVIAALVRGMVVEMLMTLDNNNQRVFFE